MRTASDTAGFHGIDLRRAEDLANELARWTSLLNQIQGDVATAETLSDLPSDTQPHLDELTSTASSLARAISTASTGLLTHKLAVDEHFKTLNGITVETPQLRRRRLSDSPRRSGPGHPLDQAKTIAEAQTLLDRIHLAQGVGRPPSPADVTRLRELFDRHIADRPTSRAAFALARDIGVPAAYALNYTTAADIDADFDRVAANMASGIAPGIDELPAVLYPDQYRSWIAGQQSASDHTPYALIDVDQLTLTTIRGKLGQVFDLPMVWPHWGPALEDWQAASSIAEHLGPVASSWLGRTLAVGASGDWGDTATLGIAQIVADDDRAALALFNTLGADGTSGIAFELGAGHRDTAMPLFAMALAATSGHPDLTFSGIDLVAADHHLEPNGYDDRNSTSQFVEQILLAEGFDTNFLVGAARTSLAQRRDGSNPARPRRAGEYVDPRSTVLAAIALNGLGHKLVAALGPDDLKDLLNNGDHTSSALRTMWLDVPNQQQLSPIEQVLVQVGHDTTATRIITDAIGAAPATWRHLADNPLIANGLSMMLVSDPLYFARTNDAQAGFIETYDIALRGGSGAHVTLLDRTLLRADVREQLNDGTTVDQPITLDVAPVATFLGKLGGTKSAVYDEHPELAGFAAERLASSLGGFSIVISGIALVTGPQSIPLGLIAIALALLASDLAGPDAAIGHLLRERKEGRTLGRQIEYDLTYELLAQRGVPRHAVGLETASAIAKITAQTNADDTFGDFVFATSGPQAQLDKVVEAARHAQRRWDDAWNATLGERKKQPTG